MSCPHANKLTASIKESIINDKANACPMIIRLAWHASGTFDKSNATGGSNGATMRFEPELTDGANAGLSIAQDLLKPVNKSNPDESIADVWTLAGAKAVEFMGGPQINHVKGRTDEPNGAKCPENGRLPDAAQGAQHLRDVFYRMGFNDRDIVALSGAHTVGRCHLSRSGFDGPWTSNPLKFDNEYFRNLLNLEWQASSRTGPGGNFQYEDVATKSLMMLPTDIALKLDPSFRVHAERYANDEAAFFRDFKSAYERLLANGCPVASLSAEEQKKANSKEFREQAMHGSLAKVVELSKVADVHECEANTNRSALHKAAYWGHTHLMPVLINDCGINSAIQDSKGDTALHDASRFGHVEVVEALLKHGADASIKNTEGKTAQDVARDYDKNKVVTILSSL